MPTFDSSEIMVRVESDANTTECLQTCDWLREYNWVANPTFMQNLTRIDSDSIPLCLSASLADIHVGGLIAITHLRWLKISVMSVSPNFRRLGIGTRLLRSAEAIAAKRGCRYSYVDTMSHQNPHFYKSCGYQSAGVLHDWDSNGHAKHFFQKRLFDNAEIEA